MKRWGTLVAVMSSVITVGILVPVLWADRDSVMPVAAAQVNQPPNATITGVIQFVHPYKPQTPIACNGGTAPGRVISEVIVNASKAGLVPITVEFGCVGCDRDGSDDYAWIEEARQEWVPVGASSFVMSDQKRDVGPAKLPAGRYYFKARAGDFIDRCEFIWKD